MNAMRWAMMGVLAGLPLLAAGLASGQEMRTLDDRWVDEEQVFRGLQGHDGSEMTYRLRLPDDVDRLVIETEGGKGDADLYASPGVVAYGGRYEYSSTSRDNTERLAIDRPRAGLWTITVRGNRAYDGLTMRIRPELGRGGRDDGRDIRIFELRNGQTERNLRGQRGDELAFRIEVPEGVRRLTILTGDGTGDVDLYVAHGRLPEPGQYDYRSAGAGGRESLAISTPRSGTWYVVVYGYEDFRDVDLTASWDGGRDDRWRRDGRADLLSPRAGETWRTGEVQTIRWRAERGIRELRIEYSLDGGRTWQVGNLPPTVDAQRQRMEVRIPRERRFLTDDFRLRLLDADGRRILAETGPMRIVRGSGEWEDGDDWRDREDDRRGREYERDRYDDRDGGYDRHRGDEDEPDRFEPDNKYDRATRVPVGRTQERTITEDDEDWLRFDVREDERYLLRVSSARVPLKVGIYTADRRGKLAEVGKDRELPRGGGLIPLGGFGRDVREIYLRVRAQDDDDEGLYTLTVLSARR